MLAIWLALLSACATYPDITQSRSPCQREPGGWCGFVREVAADAYPYAIAATQAYVGDDDLFDVLPETLRSLDRLKISDEDLETGFEYQIFEQIGGREHPRAGETIAWIMAFRGTDADLKDVWYGSINADQIKLAHKYFALERAEYDNSVPWIVAGHSLGGALATDISASNDGVNAYSFNVSPFYRSDSSKNGINRTVINERGEFLRAFRKYRSMSAADTFVINCSPQAGRFTKHGIRSLANCITWIAAYEDSEALSVVRAEANAMKKPPVECGPDDKAHPGQIEREPVPCVHIARRPEKD